MRSLTLVEYGLWTHAPPSCIRNPKSFNNRLFYPTSRLRKPNWSIFRQNSSSSLASYLMQLCGNIHEKWFGHSLQLASINPKGIDFERKSCKENTKLLHDLGGYGISVGKSTAKDNSKDNTLFNPLLKFALLFGCLTLQGSQQAVAASDLASTYLGDLGDISTGFASAFLLIFFSELGDKTFFIAALLAARNSAGIVFIGTFGALAAMTVVSVVLGRTFHYVDDILPFRIGDSDLPVDDIAAVCLLVYFGVSTLLDAASNDGLKAEEEQKEAELAVSELSGDGAGILPAANTAISTFLLVFVAEWGDKSFFSTIALAAASSPLGVIGGALAGHGVATLLAVLGGSLLGTFLSEKVIAYIGGVLFLVFAAVTLFDIVS